jgi:hypothetical protein
MCVSGAPSQAISCFQTLAACGAPSPPRDVLLVPRQFSVDRPKEALGKHGRSFAAPALRERLHVNFGRV